LPLLLPLLFFLSLRAIQNKFQNTLKNSP